MKSRIISRLKGKGYNTINIGPDRILVKNIAPTDISDKFRPSTDLNIVLTKENDDTMVWLDIRVYGPRYRNDAGHVYTFSIPNRLVSPIIDARWDIDVVKELDHIIISNAIDPSKIEVDRRLHYRILDHNIGYAWLKNKLEHSKYFNIRENSGYIELVRKQEEIKSEDIRDLFLEDE